MRSDDKQWVKEEIQLTLKNRPESFTHIEFRSRIQELEREVGWLKSQANTQAFNKHINEVHSFLGTQGITIPHHVLREILEKARKF